MTRTFMFQVPMRSTRRKAAAWSVLWIENREYDGRRGCCCGKCTALTCGVLPVVEIVAMPRALGHCANVYTAVRKGFGLDSGSSDDQGDWLRLVWWWRLDHDCNVRRGCFGCRR